MRKVLAILLVLGAGGFFALGGCTDAGDAVFPEGATIPVDITVDDFVGAWDNLWVNGALSGDTPVAMTQDGITWKTRLQVSEPGSYAFGLYTDDGSKAIVTVREGLSVSVSAAGDVSGDNAVTLQGNATYGFRLVVHNENPAYDNIKIKGSYDGWATTDRDGMSADGGTVFRNVAAGLAVGSYEWGCIHDDGSEWGIWLLPAGSPNLAFSVDAAGNVTGQTTFSIAAPAEQTTLTLNCDMNDFAGSYTTVHVRGTFNGWAQQPTDLTDNDGDGVFSVTLDVEQNSTVIFKFITDGSNYESVPASCGVDDGYGGFNRSVDVGTEPATYTAPYSGCPAR